MDLKLMGSRKSPAVQITVDYGYDIHSVECSKHDFAQISEGVVVTLKGPGFYWEGRRDQDWWIFNAGELGSLRVSTDGGGEVFIGCWRESNVHIDIGGKSTTVDHAPLSSKIDLKLLAAYRATEYRAVEIGVVMRVDESCSALLNEYAKRRTNSAAFITAWNPNSKPLAIEENGARNKALAVELQRQQLSFVNGEGVGASAWAEQSFLVFGVSMQEAQRLALAFGQNAFLFASADAIPRLVKTQTTE
jgi:hypothetical protein